MQVPHFTYAPERLWPLYRRTWTKATCGSCATLTKATAGSHAKTLQWQAYSCESPLKVCEFREIMVILQDGVVGGVRQALFILSLRGT